MESTSASGISPMIFSSRKTNGFWLNCYNKIDRIGEEESSSWKGAPASLYLDFFRRQRGKEIRNGDEICYSFLALDISEFLLKRYSSLEWVSVDLRAQSRNPRSRYHTLPLLISPIWLTLFIYHYNSYFSFLKKTGKINQKPNPRLHLLLLHQMDRTIGSNHSLFPTHSTHRSYCSKRCPTRNISTWFKTRPRDTIGFFQDDF